MSEGSARKALVAVLRGEDAVYLRARPGTALGVPCGLIWTSRYWEDLG